MASDQPPAKRSRMVRSASRAKLDLLFSAVADKEDELDVGRQVLDISQELLRSPAKVARAHRYAMSDFFLNKDASEKQEQPFSSEYHRLHRAPQDHPRTCFLVKLNGRLTSSVLGALKKKANGPKTLHQIMYAGTLTEPGDPFGPHDKTAWDEWMISRHVVAGKPLRRLSWTSGENIIDWNSISVYAVGPAVPEGVAPSEHRYSTVTALGSLWT